MKECVQQKPAKKSLERLPSPAAGKAGGGHVVLAEGGMGERAEISAHLIAPRREEALPRSADVDVPRVAQGSDPAAKSAALRTAQSGALCLLHGLSGFALCLGPPGPGSWDSV